MHLNLEEKCLVTSLEVREIWLWYGGVFGMGIPDKICLGDPKGIFGGVRWHSEWHSELQHSVFLTPF